jgi:hypothetical protein
MGNLQDCAGLWSTGLVFGRKASIETVKITWLILFIRLIWFRWGEQPCAVTVEICSVIWSVKTKLIRFLCCSWMLGQWFFSHGSAAWVGLSLLYEVAQSHSVRHTTLGRIPLDKWSAQCSDLYLTTHNRLTSMPPVGFEPLIATCERL